MDFDRCHLHVHSRLQAADCWRSALAIRGITFAAALLLTGCGQPVIEMVPAAESERSTDPDRRRRPPLEALLGSLQTYAGTAVATLAAVQAQRQRQGGALTLHEGRAFVRLPLAEAAS